MGLVEDLQKLQEMRTSGLLTDEEFQQAKVKLLSEHGNGTPPGLLGMDKPDEESLGNAANRYVTLQYVSYVVSIIIFVIFLLSFMSRWNSFP
ncbi:MAG TPA: SHOCT domain-containing protein [Armatimonadota bacterium]